MHSKFSPSSAHRWIPCTGSLNYEASINTLAASEGRIAHEIGEHLLKGGEPFSVGDEIQVKSGKIQYTEALHEAIQLYINFVHQKESEVCSKAEVEKFVKLDDDLFGTPDCIIVNAFTRLTVIDFKYGIGKIIDPYENPQLMIYAACILAQLEYKPNQIELCIVQPRSFVGEKIRTWMTTSKYVLNTFIPKIRSIIANYKQEYYNYTPGDYCTFCSGAMECPAIKDQIDALLTTPLEQSESYSSEKIGELTKILSAEAGIKEKLKQLKEMAYDLLQRGQIVPGFKLVQSYGDRQWIDPKKVKRKFGIRNCCESILMSPAKLENKLGKKSKKWINDNTTRPDRGLKLTTASDRRSEVKAIEFPEITSNTIE